MRFVVPPSASIDGKAELLDLALQNGYHRGPASCIRRPAPASGLAFKDGEAPRFDSCLKAAEPRRGAKRDEQVTKLSVIVGLETVSYHSHDGRCTGIF